jgi:hypothetical protein
MTELIEALDAPSPPPVLSPMAETSRGPVAPSGGAPRAKPGVRRRAWLVGIAAALGITAGAVGLWRRTAIPRGSPETAPPIVATLAPACASNADCVRSHGGDAWHCHSQRHVCVELASPDCKVHSEPHDPEAEDVVWLGGMFPLSNDPSLVNEMRATEIARQDFAAALGPSAARSGPLHARPIGLVICDEGVDATRAARHLAEDVEAPAVIGFRSATNALTTIPTVLLPSHVLSFVSISQSPELTRIPESADEPRLVWRSTLNRLDPPVALARLVSDVLEPRMRAERGGIGDRPLKVAAVWPKTSSHDFVEALFDALRYNGRSALDNDANFRQFVFERDTDAGVNESVVKDLLAFAPHVIVFAGEPFYGRVLAPLEAQWPASARAPRPVYLTASGLTSHAAEFAGRDPSKRHRFFAATNLSTTATNAKLVLRYNVAYPQEPTSRAVAPQPSYDAFYTLAYATYALGDAPITGPALSRAIERLLPPGRKIDVGPVPIFEGFEALRAGGRIDLNGAIGSLDFDPSTGEAPIDYAIVCPGVDDAGNAAAAVDSGLVYDSRTKKLVGALGCP